MITHRKYQLLQKDYWENNGVLDHILNWSDEGRDEILWVGGSSGYYHSSTTAACYCTLCILQRARKPATHSIEVDPTASCSAPRSASRARVPASKIQKSVSFGQTWRLFEALASELQSLFIVIDRVEECEADNHADVIHHLLPRLIDFGRRRETVSVIVTSIFDPPDEVMALPMYASYIDTTKRANRRMK